MKAIEKGYTVLKIYEVYHWEQTSDTLFREYVDTFLRIKQESSGKPSWVKTDADMERYIEQYQTAEGITLRKENIKHNPGLRTVAKLALNSFWGKFGQKPNQTKNHYFTDPVKFKRMMNDPTIEIINIHMVNEECLMVESKSRTTFEPDNLKSNDVIASFTTCWARLELYNLIDFLGRRVLYMDTDSVLYTAKEGDPMPPLGDFLGQLTDELPQGQWITEFISSGPKSYAYRLTDGSECVKFKGLTINSSNIHIVNFQSMQDLINQKLTIKLPPYNLFTRDKVNGGIFNRTTYKTAHLVFDKRILLDNYVSVPFGYLSI